MDEKKLKTKAEAMWQLGVIMAEERSESYQEIMSLLGRTADNGHELALKLVEEVCDRCVELAGSPVVSNENTEAIIEKKDKKQEEVCEEGHVLSIELPDGVKLDMVFVEKGSFPISAKEETKVRNTSVTGSFLLPYIQGLGREQNYETKVELTKSFHIGKFPLTQGQWTAIMGWNPSNFKSMEDWKNYPVEKVSWNDAMVFCDRLNEGGFAPKGWKFTLPTETQWEYAAKGGSRSSRCKYAGGDDINSTSWYDGNSERTTHAVGQKIPNKLGLHDMSGNVWEWCLDKWEDDSSNLEPEFLHNDEEDANSSRACRGGGWNRRARRCRIDSRGYYEPTARNYDLGFRLALVFID